MNLNTYPTSLQNKNRQNEVTELNLRDMPKHNPSQQTILSAFDYYHYFFT